jgi:hypothetical protein
MFMLVISSPQFHAIFEARSRPQEKDRITAIFKKYFYSSGYCEDQEIKKGRLEEIAPRDQPISQRSGRRARRAPLQ